MSVPALVPDRPDDVERLAAVGEAFAFASPEPVWTPLTAERPRAVGRLLAFVAGVGIGAGLGLWILGSLLVSAVRGLL